MDSEAKWSFIENTVITYVTGKRTYPVHLLHHDSTTLSTPHIIKVPKSQIKHQKSTHNLNYLRFKIRQQFEISPSA